MDQPVTIKFQGFTLLETVVVLAMIAVLTGISIATFRFDRGEQLVDDYAKRILQLYRATRDDAILSGSPCRLVLIDNRNLTVQKRRVSGGDMQYSDDNSLLPMPYESHSTLTLSLSPNAPIYVFPSGQTTAFRLTLRFVDDQQMLSRDIQGDAMGRITMNTRESLTMSNQP